MDSIIESVQNLKVGETLERNGWRVVCEAGDGGGRAFVVHPAAESVAPPETSPNGRQVRVRQDDLNGFYFIDAMTALAPCPAPDMQVPAAPVAPRQPSRR